MSLNINRRLQLTWEVSRYNIRDTDGIRVRITAASAALMPAKIFAYLLLPMKPAAVERVGAFDHVCSPVDLEEYPEDEPLPDHRPEWFRLDYVDVLLRSRAEVDEFIKEVTNDVQHLKTTLDLTDTLLPVGQTWIGTPPVEVLIPEFSAPTATVNGFTAWILNYDASYVWSGTATLGSVVVNSVRQVVVTGLAAGTSSTATITTTKAGFTGSATITAPALPGA